MARNNLYVPSFIHTETIEGSIPLMRSIICSRPTKKLKGSGSVRMSSNSLGMLSGNFKSVINLLPLEIKHMENNQSN